MLQKYQPEGLSDSSRWSQQSGDHRETRVKEEHPGKGARKTVAPRRGAIQQLLFPGGLRFAATTGYFRSNPPG